MSNEKQSTSVPQPNPAKSVQTPNIPTKSTRDDGNKSINKR